MSPTYKEQLLVANEKIVRLEHDKEVARLDYNDLSNRSNQLRDKVQHLTNQNDSFRSVIHLQRAHLDIIHKITDASNAHSSLRDSQPFISNLLSFIYHYTAPFSHELPSVESTTKST